METYVEYWTRKRNSSDAWSRATRVHTIATWECGCQLGYSAIGHSPLNRCNKHSSMFSWFGLPVPPSDQLSDVEKAGIVKLTYPEHPLTSASS